MIEKAGNRAGATQTAARLGTFFTWLTLLGLWWMLPILACNGAVAQAEQIESDTIRVVMDDNYPPYVFRSAEGGLQGVLIDQWQAWEAQTGIKVEIHALDWSAAQRRMRAGEFDVIDTIFDSPERRKFFDFTQPYATIEVPIYFREEISGIVDLKSLAGFLVAAKAGDYAVDLLTAAGVENLQLFPNYEAIITAANEGKVNVFVVDVPPANYYLNKLGIEGQFRRSPPVNLGQLHRAVQKGNTALLDTVEQGFKDVGAAALAEIDKKWFGEEIISKRYELFAGYVLLAVIALLLLALGWNRALSRKVKQRTAELREGEQKLRRELQAIEQIYAFSPIGLFAFDRDYRYLRINELMAEVNGFPVEYHIGKTVDEVLPELAIVAKKTLRTVLERGETILNVEIHGRTPKEPERERDWICNYFPLKSETGEVIGLMGAAMEITERKQAEAAVWRAHSEYEALVSSIDGIVWEADAQTFQFSYVSAMAERLLGYPRSQWTTEPTFWQDHIHPEDRREALSFCALYTAENRDHEFEYRMIAADGREVWLRDIVTVVMEGGQRVKLRGLMIDITDRKRAGAALRESEVRFRELAENMQEVFWVLDRSETSLLYVNPAYEKVWGRSCESLYEAPLDWVESVHPDDRERLATALKLKQPSDAYAETYRIINPHNGIRWIRDRSFPVHDDKGEFVRVVRASEDVTEMRELEEQLRQSQKMEAVGQLSSGVAHDFNNILSAIQMNAALLSAIRELPGEAANFVSDIETAVGRAAGLTRQLLAFGRKQVMNRSEADLNVVVQGMGRMLTRVLEESVKLEFKFDENPLPMNADTGMIEQVLLNLSINARDAMPDGGVLRISTARVKANVLAPIGSEPGKKRQSREKRDYIRISVRDNGKGMLPEVTARIFEPFFTTKEVGGGSGLGLAAVHGIIHQHDGFVEVDSEPGKGTEFRVYIPLLAQSCAAPIGVSKPPPVHSTTAGGETILVVEDEASVRNLVLEILKQAGYKVLAAENGVSALAVWRNKRDSIQLMMTDIVMPEGMTGVELVAQIHADKPQLPVLFTSGYAPDTALAGLSMEEGVNFLQKPFKIERLLGIIRQALDEAQGPA